jgi:hypothetical protein
LAAFLDSLHIAIGFHESLLACEQIVFPFSPLGEILIKVSEPQDEPAKLLFVQRLYLSNGIRHSFILAKWRKILAGQHPPGIVTQGLPLAGLSQKRSRMQSNENGGKRNR